LLWRKIVAVNPIGGNSYSLLERYQVVLASSIPNGSVDFAPSGVQKVHTIVHLHIM